jgi:hypothetical protein
MRVLGILRSTCTVQRTNLRSVGTCAMAVSGPAWCLRTKAYVVSNVVSDVNNKYDSGFHSTVTNQPHTSQDSASLRDFHLQRLKPR